jgi:hypothetical protein
MSKTDLDSKIGKWFWANREHRIRLAVLEGLFGTITFILLPSSTQGTERYIEIVLCYLFIFGFMYWLNQKVFKKYK